MVTGKRKVKKWEKLQTGRMYTGTEFDQRKNKKITPVLFSKDGKDLPFEFYYQVLHH
jgi:hypothetical protein